jgi:uncharacterized protein (DUF58 family)
VSVVLKFFYWIYYAGSSLGRWAGRRFTPAGFWVAGTLLAATAVGVDVENTVVFQAFSLLLALLLPAFVCSWFFRGKFSALRQLPRLGTAGQPLYYRVVVGNLTAVPQNGLALLEELADLRPAFPEWQAHQLAENRRIRPFQFHQRYRPDPFKLAMVREGEVPPLSPRAETEVNLELLPLRRGILRFEGVTLARPDPLGLFRSFARVPAPQTVLILPKRYVLPPIALPGSMKYQEGGVALAANVGRSEEFVALRDYRRGDPLRHIHWRSWAKTDKPIVKEFEDEFFVRHALVLDTFAQEPYCELLEEAVAVAASFACTVLTQESLLDLLFVGAQSYCFTAGRGLAHTDRMLEILAAVRSCRDKPFRTLEHLVLNHSTAVSGCVCVLLAWDEARRDLVKKLQALRIPLLVLVIVLPGQDSLEAGPLRDEPHRFRVLKLGQIQEGLEQLIG